jgi:hypothetical protein
MEESGLDPSSVGGEGTRVLQSAVSPAEVLAPPEAQKESGLEGSGPVLADVQKSTDAAFPMVESETKSLSGTSPAGPRTYQNTEQGLVTSNTVTAPNNS